jgi:hypothetical protein
VHADRKQRQRHNYHDGLEGTHGRSISRAMRDCSR